MHLQPREQSKGTPGEEGGEGIQCPAQPHAGDQHGDFLIVIFTMIMMIRMMMMLMLQIRKSLMVIMVILMFIMMIVITD